MSPIKRTRHAVYDLKYHFVWTPKYRQQILKGDVAEFVEATLRRIAEEYEWEIDELAVQVDHVHVFMQVTPRYAPAQVVQIMKSITAREVFEQFPQLRKRLWAGEFWGAGYFVRRVGDALTAEVIRNYIRYQDTDHATGQLSHGTNAPQLAAGSFTPRMERNSFVSACSRARSTTDLRAS